MVRLSLTAKTVLVTSLVALLVVGVTVLIHRAFERLHHRLEDIVSVQLEQLMSSVRLVQKTESFVSLGLVLVHSSTHNQRRQALIDFQDQLAWSDKMSHDLWLEHASPDFVERLRTQHRQLADNMQALNALVRLRIDGEASPDMELRIRALSDENRELANKLSVMVGYVAASTRSQLTQHNVQLAAEVKQQQRYLVGLAVFVLLSVVLSGVYFEWRLVRRILRLQYALRHPQVQASDLRLTGRDELAQLGHTVGQYVVRIQAQEAQLRRINDDLVFLAEHDPLTQLANRRHFNAAAQRLLQHSTLPLCVVMGDIDHFKRVNDGYGHAVGDVALVHVARQIAAGLRANDVLARFGGEEFAAILPVHHLEQGQEVVDRIRAHIAQQPLVLADGRSLPLTLSFGLAMIEQVPLAASTDAQRILLLINEAIRLADDALYQAKASGRNCVRLAPGALNAQVFVREL